MRTRILTTIEASALAVFGALGAASAQNIQSTADLKLACETSPGNVVNIQQPVLIFLGARPPAYEVVNTGCTINIGLLGKLETKEIGMSFNGPLTIQSPHKMLVSLGDSSLRAASVNISLPASDSVLLLSESNLQSTMGNTSITFGPVGKIEFTDVLPFQPFIINAAGVLNISGGQKFVVIFKGGNLQAGTGLSIAMTGADVLLLNDKASLMTATGVLSVSALTNKATMTFNQGTYSAGSGVSVSLAGAESSVSIKDADFSTTLGSVTVEVGAAGATKGKLEISQSRFTAPGSLSLFASQQGTLGTVLVDNVDLTGAGGVRVESGAGGTTIAKNSRGTSSTLFHILTGLGGKCLAENNLITSPNQRLCF